MLYQTNPTFKDSVGQILSSGDLRVLRQNVHTLDGLSFRTMPLLDNSGPSYTGAPGTYKDTAPFRIWKGYFRFRTGMTTLTIVGRTTATSGITLKVYLNG